MACRFKFVLIIMLLSLTASGCLSLRIEKADVGSYAPGPESRLTANLSTLNDALKLLGAPDEIIDMEGKIAIVYEKGIYTGTQLSLGIPLSESVGPDLNMSGYGRLWKYDRLTLFFSPEWVLLQSVYVKGGHAPYLKTLFKDREDAEGRTNN